MIWLAIMGIVALGFAVVGMLSSITCARMVEETNRKRVPNSKLDFLFWNPVRFVDVCREYRDLCPSGRQFRRLKVLICILIFIWLAAACLLFLTPHITASAF